MGRDILQHRLTMPNSDDNAREVVADMLRRRGLDQGDDSIAAILGLPWTAPNGARVDPAAVQVIDPPARPDTTLNPRTVIIGPNSRRQFSPDWLGWGEWVHNALCRGSDPELWSLVGSTLTPDNEYAIAVCRRCPVRDQCGDEAEAWGDTGVIRGGKPFANGDPWIRFSYTDEDAAVKRFLAERCIVSPHLTATAGDMFGAWTAWCLSQGDPPGSRRVFAEALKRYGIESRRTHDRACWIGVRVRPKEPGGP